MDSRFKINEIFYSLQGEGFHTGTACVFVRFSGCNLHCPFCDTRHQDGKMMSAEDILCEIKKYPTHHVILTGGEPSLFITESFVEKIKKNDYIVHIETNGTRELPRNIDWVTFSPKTDSVLETADEIKVIYEGQDISKWETFNAKHHYLQPCTCDDEKDTKRNIEKTVEYIKQHPKWKLSVQLHKLIQIP